jgi:hypothetical protein
MLFGLQEVPFEVTLIQLLIPEEGAGFLRWLGL